MALLCAVMMVAGFGIGAYATTAGILGSSRTTEARSSSSVSIPANTWGANVTMVDARGGHYELANCTVWKYGNTTILILPVTVAQANEYTYRAAVFVRMTLEPEGCILYESPGSVGAVSGRLLQIDAGNSDTLTVPKYVPLSCVPVVGNSVRLTVSIPQP